MSVLDAGALDAAGGLFLLLDHTLDPLEPGARLELRAGGRDLDRIEDDLRSFCRVSGHRLLERKEVEGAAVFAIERGDALPVAGGARPVRAAAPPERADPSSGFAPRGAAAERGGPPFDFDLCDRAHAWVDEAPELYRQATLSQWSVERDIPWSALPRLSEPLERAVGQIMSFLAENELSALYVPAGHLPRIHPHYAEVALFLATQMADEARHIEAFTRRAEALGGTLGYSTSASQASLRTLLEEPDFGSATFLLSVLGEGTFLDLLRFIEVNAPDPVTAEIAARARQDEARHVRFGVSLVRGLLERDPDQAERLARAARERAARLASLGASGIAGANRHVHRSLCILAARGLDPARLPEGLAAVRELQETMYRHRLQRLTACGFATTEAESLSEGHTPNFM